MRGSWSSGRLANDPCNGIRRPFFGVRGMLMDADRRGIDHLNIAVVGGGYGFEDRRPDAGLAPAVKTIGAGRAGTVAIRQVFPRRARPQTPEDTVENPAIIDTRHAASAAITVRSPTTRNPSNQTVPSIQSSATRTGLKQRKGDLGTILWVDNLEAFVERASVAASVERRNVARVIEIVGTLVAYGDG